MASEKDINNRVNRQISATDTKIENFTLKLERFLKSNLSKILSKLESGKVSGAEAAAQVGGILTELKSRGLNKELLKIREIYADELKFISDELAEQGFQQIFSGTDRQVVDALINLQTTKTANQVEKFGIDIQSQVLNQVIAGQEIDVRAITDELTPRLESNIRTEINTAVMAFNRTITAKKADELGLDLFLYVGPYDDVTRPFCDHLLDRNPPIYTKEEINKMDNDQGLSVMTYGGGYNCRHHWRAISKQLAESLGYRG